MKSNFLIGILILISANKVFAYPQNGPSEWVDGLELDCRLNEDASTKFIFSVPYGQQGEKSIRKKMMEIDGRKILFTVQHNSSFASINPKAPSPAFQVLKFKMELEIPNSAPELILEQMSNLKSGNPWKLRFPLSSNTTLSCFGSEKQVFE
ncbi:MAG: hypothetical protein ACK5WZ_03590 [Pseudobdellovibrionaceae bacterium]